MDNIGMKRTTHWNLTVTDTLILKGIAICGMLCWHLFYCPNPAGVVFSSFCRWVGIIGDVCVSAFLFCSGYGLTVQYMKYADNQSNSGGVGFILCRLVKFYSRYWIILVFVLPIGIFIFHRPLIDSNSFIEISKALLREIFAISGHSSYNGSWWFNALVIEIYLLFPVLYYGLRNAFMPTLVFVILERKLSFSLINLSMQLYLPIVVVGMICAMYSDSISQYARKLSNRVLYTITAVLLVVPIIALPILDNGAIYARGIKLYGILTIGIVMSIVFLQPSRYWFGKCLALFGKHSSNIYWIHTFIFYYWFPKQFYGINNPIMIFLALMGVCLLISIGLETLKEVCSYNTSVNSLMRNIDLFLLKILK